MRRRIDWPPPAREPKKVRGVQQNKSGTKTMIPLHREPYDSSLHGDMFNICCDCLLEHHIVFEVFREKRGQWWINKRVYRVGKAKP